MVVGALDDGRPWAVIGAGISGLACARTLGRAGMTVEVYDKGRKAGGRLSTRRSQWGTFDHGAQYFTARDPAFVSQVSAWQALGVAAPWEGRIAVIRDGEVEPAPDGTTRYVGVPTMSSLARELAQSLDVRAQTRVVGLERRPDGWWLTLDDGTRVGPRTGVVMAMPPAQTAELLEGEPDVAHRVGAVQMTPCWAAMVVPEEPLPVPFDGAFVHGASLSWVARDSSKPGRAAGGHECWVLHATPDWSRSNFDLEPAGAARAMVDAFSAVAGNDVGAIRYGTAHRWGYAAPVKPYPERCIWRPRMRLGICGDWCGGPRVEGAYLSGLAVARRILDAVGER